jgi:hypothetical protein
MGLMNDLFSAVAVNNSADIDRISALLADQGVTVSISTKGDITFRTKRRGVDLRSVGPATLS